MIVSLINYATDRALNSRVRNTALEIMQKARWTVSDVYELRHKVLSRLPIVADSYWQPGMLFSNCNYHPVLVTEVDFYGDDLTGVDLFGGYQTGCSMIHCAPYRLTAAQVATRLGNRDEWLAAEKKWRDSNGEDRSGYDALFTKENLNA